MFFWVHHSELWSMFLIMDIISYSLPQFTLKNSKKFNLKFLTRTPNTGYKETVYFPHDTISKVAKDALQNEIFPLPRSNEIFMHLQVDLSKLTTRVRKEKKKMK